MCVGVEIAPQHNPEVPGGSPAHIMGMSQTYGAEPLLARAHHGSVSKEQRAAVEDDLRHLVDQRQLVEQHRRRHQRLNPLDPLVADLLSGHRVHHLLVLSNAWEL